EFRGPGTEDRRWSYAVRRARRDHLSIQQCGAGGPVDAAGRDRVAGWDQPGGPVGAKGRGREGGHSYCDRRRMALGARPMRAGVDAGVWVWDALEDVHAVRKRHGGNLRYVMLTSRAARRQVLLRLPGGPDAEPGSCLVGTLGFLAGRGITGLPYPKQVDAL